MTRSILEKLHVLVHPRTSHSAMLRVHVLKANRGESEASRPFPTHRTLQHRSAETDEHTCAKVQSLCCLSCHSAQHTYTPRTACATCVWRRCHNHTSSHQGYPLRTRQVRGSVISPSSSVRGDTVKPHAQKLPLKADRRTDNARPFSDYARKLETLCMNRTMFRLSSFVSCAVGDAMLCHR